MNNGKKEFPINALEQDCTFARRFFCYTKNIKGITSFVKKQLNRRFRKSNKKLCKINKHEYKRTNKSD